MSVRLTPGARKAEGYIFSGSPLNWQAALKDNIWGLRSSHKSEWLGIREGDPAFFYATSPVSGLIGCGTVVRTFEGEDPYWPDEVREGQVKYPYRIEFEVTSLLDRPAWRARSAKITHLGPVYYSGINRILASELIAELRTLAQGLS